jgi:hypothetical protein
MAINNRIFYAIQAIGFAEHNITDGAGEPSGFITAHGVQSVDINTTFNLEQVFELGQLEIYENIEGIPDIEITTQRVLDGYPLLYHLATQGATANTLVGRSNERTFVALNIYPDTQDNSSGVPITSVGMSGVFVSALTYTLNVDGNSTEDVTLVGNNKLWVASGFQYFMPDFDGTDAPIGSGGVQRREDVIMGSGARGDVSYWPTEIPGIHASGWNLEQDEEDAFSAHIQTVTVSVDLGREDLLELGRRGPYHRFANFPVEVTCSIEVTSSEGDLVDALADPPGGTNLVDQTIDIVMREGTRLNLGDRNKLSSVSYGGGSADGGNVATVFEFSNFNSLVVSHPEDPAGL